MLSLSEILRKTMDIILAELTLQSAKLSPEFFTRKRNMTFPEIVLFILKSFNTSTHTALRRFFTNDLKKEEKHMSQQALSKARSHFDHSPFEAIFRNSVDMRYSGEHDFALAHGYQVLAIDGSTVALPDVTALLDAFGGLGRNADSPAAKASILYDVPNDFILDAAIDRVGTSERELAVRHIEKLSGICPETPKLIIFDRGYPSAELIKELNQRNIKFLMRVKRKWNLDVDAIDKPEGVVRLAGGTLLRVIRFQLPGGEMETLITDLFELPFDVFPELYFMRWPVETKYDLLKNKLLLENFTGYSKNVILQDFWASMALCNFIAVAKAEASAKIHQERANKDNKYVYVPNQNSLIAILRDHLVAACCSSDRREQERLFAQIEAEIRKSVIPLRPNRSVERNPSPRKVRFHHNKKLPS